MSEPTYWADAEGAANWHSERPEPEHDYDPAAEAEYEAEMRWLRNRGES